MELIVILKRQKILIVLFFLSAKPLKSLEEVLAVCSAGPLACAGAAATIGAVAGGFQIYDLRKTRTYKISNFTDEFIDIEIPLVALLSNQNRLAERIAPGETINIETSGCMEKGFNIWRTYRPRNWTGLLGVWRTPDKPCEGEWIIRAKENIFNPNNIKRNWQQVRDTKVQQEIWDILNKDNQKILKEGNAYDIITKVPNGKFLQGSNEAWTNRLPSKLS